jgi:hypothetical protein
MMQCDESKGGASATAEQVHENKSILQIPLDRESIQRMQKRQLLRFILLCTEPRVLQYYMGIALEHVQHVAINVPLINMSSIHSLRHSTNITWLRFGLLLTLNCSAHFSEWVLLYSCDDNDVNNSFMRILSTHFRYLIERVNDKGQPSNTPGDVLYNDLDTFVLSLMKIFVRLQ